MKSPSEGRMPSVPKLHYVFSDPQRSLLDYWKNDRSEWNVSVSVNEAAGAEMIVIELPPYLDIDGIGLNLRNWIIYPSDGEKVRVLFWDDQESHYDDLARALQDIAELRASRS